MCLQEVRKGRLSPCVHLFVGFQMPRATFPNHAPLCVYVLDIFPQGVVGKARGMKCAIRIFPQPVCFWKKSRKCNAVFTLTDWFSANPTLGLSSKYQCHMDSVAILTLPPGRFARAETQHCLTVLAGRLPSFDLRCINEELSKSRSDENDWVFFRSRNRDYVQHSIEELLGRARQSRFEVRRDFINFTFD